MQERSLARQIWASADRNRPIDWNFPSPNATPTHQVYNNDVFTTPKTTTLPSHFQDAFTTPQMTSMATPGQFPRSTIPPAQPLIMPPPQAISPNIQWQHNPLSSPSQAQMDQSFGSTQIQTPPPTRDSEMWKQQQQQQQQVAFGTPSTITTKRFITPQRPAKFAPVQFGALQFPNIDTNQIMNAGPATAPVQSSSLNFWDSLASPSAMRQVALDDPFMHKQIDGNDWSLTQSQSTFDLASGFSEQPISAATTTLPSSIPLMDQSLPNGSVNPSLVYSSPVSAMVRPKPSKIRVPRHDNGDSSAARHTRLDSSGSEKLFSHRPNTMLRRSNTTGSAKSASFSASADMLERLIQPRTASPLKRVGKTPLGSISESSKQRRAPVILTVDESGLAHTKTIQDHSSDTMRARYPGLYDSDSSDAESDSSLDPPSRTGSFAFSRREDRKQKASKLDPPIEKFENLSIPRSSSSASGRIVNPSRAAVAAAAQLRRQGSLRRSSSGRLSIARKVPAAPIDTHPMTLDDDGQDWPLVERQLEHDTQHITSRRLRSSSTMQNTLDAHNRRWSMMSVEHQQPETVFSNTQPHYRSMSCVCGTPGDHGSSVVQCMLCTRWSHSACVGLRAGSSSQSSFTCFLCTRPPSNGLMH